MTRSVSVTTIVVNWNGRAHLERCLASLTVQTFESQQILLVDNGSSDGSADNVEARFPHVQVIRLPGNAGFARGNNVAIRQSASDYVALINNDAYAEPDWLTRLVQHAEADTRVGSVACKMLFADAPHMINSAGLAIDWAGFFWDREGGQLDDPSETVVRECFGPSGGAALYRRAMLDEIGLFDEDFFAYAEDVDLSWRAQRAGWRCLYVPNARVYHAASAASIEGSPFKQFLLGRNKIWTFAKNMPGGRYVVWIVLLVVYDLIAVVYGLLTRGEVSAVRGRWAGLRGLPRMIRKRRESKTSTNNYLQLIQPLEPPWKIASRFKHIQARIRAQQMAR